MFFTPGRVIGLIVLVAVVLALGALLKRLDAAISGTAPDPTRSSKSASPAGRKQA